MCPQGVAPTKLSSELVSESTQEIPATMILARQNYPTQRLVVVEQAHHQIETLDLNRSRIDEPVPASLAHKA